jgi:hypothetical protein
LKAAASQDGHDKASDYSLIVDHQRRIRHRLRPEFRKCSGFCELQAPFCQRRETCICPGRQTMRHPGNAELPHCLRVDDNKLTPCSLAKMLKVRLRRNLIRSN